MTDGSSLVLAGLVIIGMITAYGICTTPQSRRPNGSASKKKPRPKPNPPASVRAQVEREFNELRDMLNIMICSSHHRFLEITKGHINDMLEKYENAVTRYGDDMAAWKEETTKND